MTVSRLVRGVGVAGYTICTSSTRPLSPPVGAKIYETDTARELIYSGATVGWTLPWSMPWGIITQVGGGDVTTTGATVLAITSGATFTALANRYYKTTLTADTLGSVLGDIFALDAREGSIAGATTHLPSIRITIDLATGQEAFCAVSSAYTLSAGSHTAVGCASRVAGSGTLRLSYGVFTTVLMIEDVGPAGLPS